ncbi:MAG: TonB-dependent receptor plug domain-containing protein [bacterium]
MISKLFLRPFICAVVLIPLWAVAQEGTTITGKVTDEVGNVMIGANVVLVGYDLGSATDAEGNYTFLVPANQVEGQTVNLRATFIGYRPKSAKITLSPGTLTQNFALPEDILRMGEIVVTGLGETTVKEKLGVTINKIEPQLITEANAVNIVEALAAKAPNVEVTASSGDPGASAYLRIRGAQSITGGTQPLFVVDGIPISNQSFPVGNTTAENNALVGGPGGTQNRAIDLLAEDFESVDILKGAAASAVYGSRAGNGVIMFSSKRGRPGKVNISYKFSYSFDHLNKRIPLQEKFGHGTNGVAPNIVPGVVATGNSWGPALSADNPVFNHYDELYETGHNLENVVTLSGGNQNTTFYLSAGRLAQDGVSIGETDYI